MVNPPLPEPSQLFARFDADNTSDGAARDRFEQFVTDLVSVQWTEATTVAARNHNDWGIDTFVGDLGGGDIQVWQSKYFLGWQDNGPQDQVRDSFASAQKQATEHANRIIEWTLVVPAILHPKQMHWFAEWSKRSTRATGTRIRLWSGDKLRQRLMSAEAHDVRREYFQHTVAPEGVLAGLASAARGPAVAFTDDYAAFDDALFVRQLQAAGQQETSAACGPYVAPDALRRDLEAKQSKTELQALRTVQMDIHTVWEMRFNEHAATATASGIMPRLYSTVIVEAAALPDAQGLVLQRAHKQGAAHMLVEEQKAGWVTHWRDIAAAHAASKAELTADMPTVSLPEDVSVGRESGTSGGAIDTDSKPVPIRDSAMAGKGEHE